MWFDHENNQYYTNYLDQVCQHHFLIKKDKIHFTSRDISNESQDILRSSFDGF